jgi:hypothetical protein
LYDLAGFRIYYGTVPGQYSSSLDVGNVETYTVGNLPGGTIYFTVTAIDSSNNESNFSVEVSKTFP